MTQSNKEQLKTIKIWETQTFKQLPGIVCGSYQYVMLLNNVSSFYLVVTPESRSRLIKMI